MNSNELQQIKMAWVAAEEAGDKQAQFALLRDHPDAQDALIDFIAAYHITDPAGSEAALLPLTERAYLTALERIFKDQAVGARFIAPDQVANLRELRAHQGLSMVEAARGLRLGVDVWKKLEDGMIELASLSERQLTRLAQFFHVTAEQFGGMLLNSQPVMTINRRQTAQAARSQQSAKKQSFAEALEKSSMSRQEKETWLDE